MCIIICITGITITITIIIIIIHTVISILPRTTQHRHSLRALLIASRTQVRILIRMLIHIFILITIIVTIITIHLIITTIIIIRLLPEAMKRVMKVRALLLRISSLIFQALVP